MVSIMIKRFRSPPPPVLNSFLFFPLFVAREHRRKDSTSVPAGARQADGCLAVEMFLICCGGFFLFS